MYSTTLFLIGVISLCSAQSTTTLFLPGFGDQVYLASVVGSGAPETTYALACPASVSSDKCNIQSVTITEGTATAHFSLTAPGFFATNACSLGGTTTAICVYSASPTPSTETGPAYSTTAIDGTLLASQYHVVVLTDNLPGATQSATTTSMSSTTATSQTSSLSAAAASNISTSSATAASKTSSAGISQITGNAGWAVGGVALAMAVVGL